MANVRSHPEDKYRDGQLYDYLDSGEIQLIFDFEPEPFNAHIAVETSTKMPSFDEWLEMPESEKSIYTEELNHEN